MLKLVLISALLLNTVHATEQADSILETACSIKLYSELNAACDYDCVILNDWKNLDESKTRIAECVRQLETEGLKQD